MLAYSVIAGPVPVYLNALLREDVTPACCTQEMSVIVYWQLNKPKTKVDPNLYFPDFEKSYRYPSLYFGSS